MLRCRTFFSQIPFFSPRAEGMVRLAAPRFSCAAPFFAAGEKKCAGPFSPEAKKSFWVCFAAGEKKWCVFRRRRFFFDLFFVMFSSQMLCLGLVSSFGIEYFTSFENSIETVASNSQTERIRRTFGVY